jgi:multidrug transporter EmrE-like cation transporter
MKIALLGLILGSVMLSAIAQLLLKLGMSSSSVQEALNQHNGLGAIWPAISNMHVLTGLGLYLLGAGIWLLVLARLDLSLAYPFVGFGFILTMCLGWWVLDEPVGLTRIAGTLLVASGIWLVSVS